MDYLLAWAVDSTNERSAHESIQPVYWGTWKRKAAGAIWFSAAQVAFHFASLLALSHHNYKYKLLLI